MPKKLCLESRCANEAQYRGRCQVHARSRERQTHGNRAIYSTKRWKLLRRRRLFIEPLCRDCGVVANTVDHVIAIEDGGDPYRLGNTQSLCASCHSRKTSKELLLRMAVGRGGSRTNECESK